MFLSRRPVGSLWLSLALAACASEEGSRLASRSLALVDEGVTSALSEGAAASVIVHLRIAESESRSETELIAEAQEALLARQISGFALSRRYRHVAAVAGRADAAAVQRLASEPGVWFVQYDQRGAGQLKETVPAVGGDLARSMFGVTGRGVRVAVLDTGVNTTHPDLRDAIVAQHCFTQFDCAPRGNEGTSAEDDHGHGSNVAGIIASDGVVSSRGFAPDAELVAVKINDANDSGQESDWIAGMDWVYDNLATNKVKLVNLSIGTTALYAGGDPATCDRAHPAMASAIKKLVDAGVTVFAATGNRGSTTSMPAPACNTGVIAVGAVYDASAGRQPPLAIGSTYNARWGAAFASCSDATSAFDQIACFTNSTARMDLLAPGAPIISDSLRGRTEEYWGTSQAAPVAVGVAALMLQCDPDLTPAQIKQVLTSTGVPRMDARNGLTFPSLRALAAVQAVCKDAEPVTPVMDAGAPPSDAGSDARATADAAPVSDAKTNAPTLPADASTLPETPKTPPGSTATPDAAAAPTPTSMLDAGSSAPVSAMPEGDAGCDCAATAHSAHASGAPAFAASLGLSLALWRRRRRG